MPSVTALAAVADAVAGRAEVLLDGGIRRGTDVIKALALGADAVLIGRPALYGMAVAGDRGVEHVLTLLRGEIERGLTLLGVRDVRDLNVRNPGERRHTALVRDEDHRRTHRATCSPATRRAATQVRMSAGQIGRECRR